MWSGSAVAFGADPHLQHQPTVNSPVLTSPVPHRTGLREPIRLAGGFNSSIWPYPEGYLNILSMFIASSRACCCKELLRERIALLVTLGVARRVMFMDSLCLLLA